MLQLGKCRGPDAAATCSTFQKHFADLPAFLLSSPAAAATDPHRFRRFMAIAGYNTIQPRYLTKELILTDYLVSLRHLNYQLKICCFGLASKD